MSMSQSTPAAPRPIRCPGCGGPSLYSAGNPYRPFCSERCRNHDFSAWATESYRVAAKPEIDSEDPADPATPTH